MALRDFLNAEKVKGKSIHLYGASTKGNVLLQFFGIDYTSVVAAADRNPEKWGRRTPGTHIPIISEAEARDAESDYFLVLPWHFREEFIAREADFLSSGGKFVFPLPELEIVGHRTDEKCPLTGVSRFPMTAGIQSGRPGSARAAVSAWAGRACRAVTRQR